MSKVLNNELKKASKIDKKIEAFSDLLDSIDSLEDKKKLLWKQIYEHALNDRNRAKLLYDQMYLNITSAGGGQADHLSAGSTMVKYIERLTKSNEQILKLAELISREQEKSARIDSDDMFDAIGS